MKRIRMRCPYCSIYGSVVVQDRPRYRCRNPVCTFKASAEPGWVRLLANLIQWAADDCPGVGLPEWAAAKLGKKT